MIQLRKATCQDSAAASMLLHVSQGLASVPVHGLGSAERALVFYESMFRLGGTFWSYDMTVVAEDDGEVVGLIAYYPSEQRLFREEHNNTAIRRFFHDRDCLDDYCSRAARYHDGIPLAPFRDGVYVSSFAVHPDFRRRGVGLSLLHSADLARKRHQCDCCLAHVESRNQPALAAFQAHGYSIRERGSGPGCQALCGFDGYLLLVK